MAMVSSEAAMAMVMESLGAVMAKVSLEKVEGCSGEAGEMRPPAGVALSASH